MKRPALILSLERFKRKIKPGLAAPITSTVRGHGFEVKLADTKMTGVVLCHRVKVIDYEARGVRFIEKAPRPIIVDVLAKVRLLVN